MHIQQWLDNDYTTVCDTVLKAKKPRGSEDGPPSACSPFSMAESCVCLHDVANSTVNFSTSSFRSLASRTESLDWLVGSVAVV